VKLGDREDGWVSVTGELPQALNVVLDGFELPARQPVSVRATWTRETWSSRPKD